MFKIDDVVIPENAYTRPDYRQYWSDIYRAIDPETAFDELMDIYAMAV